ncbi:hypothetical protein DAH66_00345 [Sphingomonas koreensis]|uniref:Uncharacterized protein n=2 Tax=Sphingomonas koreensis TaxID=93064 RepID=A0A430G9D3_9SPHN|nr:hypothetical protein DAH56_11210 [Sphingomonas koreensis]RSU68782.1 hypothetical protein DAH55_10585 [Sphingomonas koreensis]RSY90753.1 hypothetical protein DAH66_00345 [Sphingomonas koreensis]
MTIEAMLVLGALAGLAIGMIASRERSGCLMLLAIPIVAFVYVWIWQAQHPESLRSTSALEFVFGPLWPSIGAVAGYVLGRLGRAATRRPPTDNGS